MKWFTADQHYGHTNIIKYCNRPFKNIEEQDEALIKNHNDVVDENDDVYIIGDFAFRNVREYSNKLKGKLHLIIGNHDKASLKEKNCFESIKQYDIINIGNKPVVLCHYAMRVLAFKPLQLLALIWALSWITRR